MKHKVASKRREPDATSNVTDGISSYIALERREVIYKYTTGISSRGLPHLVHNLGPHLNHSIHLLWHQQPSPPALAGRGTKHSKGSWLAPRPAPLLVSQQQGCFIGLPLGLLGRPFRSTAGLWRTS